MSRSRYYSDSSVSGSGWTLIQFSLNPTTLVSISADPSNSDDLYVSWDGSNIHYRLKAGEPLNLTNDFVNQLWLKPKSGSQSYRLLAY